MLMDRAGSVNEAIGKVEVRQAINYAIDRDAMLQAVAQGHGTVTGQVFPETSPGYDAALDEAYPFDPEKAKELLAEAGYADGFELDMPLLQVGTHDELRPGQAVPRRRGHHGQLHPARRERRHRGHRRRQVRRHVLPAADGPDRVAGGQLPAHSRRRRSTRSTSPTRRSPTWSRRSRPARRPRRTPRPRSSTRTSSTRPGSTRGTASRATSPPTRTPTSLSRATTPTRTSGTSSRRPDPSDHRPRWAAAARAAAHHPPATPGCRPRRHRAWIRDSTTRLRRGPDRRADLTDLPAALPERRRHRPGHPRPERHPRDRRAEEAGARARPAAAAAVRRLGVERPAGRPRRRPGSPASR